MFRILAIVFFLFCFSREGFSQKVFVPERLHEELELQIDKSLESFDTQLSKKSLDQLFHENGRPWVLMRVRYQKGKLSFEETVNRHGVHESWRQIFQRLYRLNRLPKVDFDLLITAHDALPCPNCSEVVCSNGIYLPKKSDSLVFDGKRIPIFVQADCNHGQLILFPDFLHLGSASKYLEIRMENHRYPWANKKPILFFRGGDSGICKKEFWPYCQRPYLAKLSVDYPEWIDAKLSLDLHHKEWKDYARNHGLIGNYVSIAEHGAYKYLLDIDGNCASNPRNQFLMFTGSTIFKAMTNSRSWFYPCIKPFVHFIPIENDFSDLFSQIDWALENDSECQKIAGNALNLAKKIFSQDYIDSYIYRLLHKYANKQSRYYLDME